MIQRVSVSTLKQGLHDVTSQVAKAVSDAKVTNGLCTLFIQHTSASLVIQENADPAARTDLEKWFNRLVMEGDPMFTHTEEGPDDMPSHIKAAMTATSISIPIMDGRLALGRWQGICVWEHRHKGGTRNLVIHIAADDIA